MMIRKMSALALLLAALSGLQAKDGRPEPLKTLHVVQVFDTNDEDLKDSLVIDEKRMTKFWTKYIPSGRLNLITLTGEEAFPAGISQTLRTLRRKVQPDDAVVFYFGGHGALIEKPGREQYHVIRFRSGQDIERASIRKMLESCKAGLTVLLTDCCSTKEKYDGPIDKPLVVGRDKIPPVIESLFFRSRGMVDVTAATEEEAWSDNEQGGLFTRSLEKLFLASPDKVGGKGDAVTWEQFFPHLQKDTQTFFKSWSDKMKARYPNCPIRAETQKPHAFFLGKQQAYNAVELENQRKTPLKYKYRWRDDEEWIEWTIEPGKRFCHFRPLDDKGELVPLKIFREGADKENQLNALKWDKDTAPRLGSRYVIRPKK